MPRLLLATTLFLGLAASGAALAQSSTSGTSGSVGAGSGPTIEPTGSGHGTITTPSANVQPGLNTGGSSENSSGSAATTQKSNGILGSAGTSGTGTGGSMGDSSASGSGSMSSGSTGGGTGTQ